MSKTCSAPQSATHCDTPQEAHPAKRLLRLLCFPKCVGQFRVIVFGTGGTVSRSPGGFRPDSPERALLPIPYQLSCIAFLFPASKGFFFISWGSIAATKSCQNKTRLFPPDGKLQPALSEYRITLWSRVREWCRREMRFLREELVANGFPGGVGDG